MALFDGAFTALITPFTADGSSVDAARLREQIERQAAGGVSGVVPCGTTGEAPTLSEQEHRSVVEQTIEHARRHGLTVIAGAGSNSTAHALHLHRFVHRAGADAALHVTPYYNRPSQEGLYRHFSALADACELPIVLYNVPGRTGVTMTLPTIERLAAHPNIQAIKDATGGISMISATLGRTDLAVLSGDDPLTLAVMALGGSGVISVISNLLPQRVAALCRAMAAGDLAGARAMHDELAPIAEPLLSLDSNPIPIKTAMSLLGLDSGALRLPLVRPGSDVTRRLEELLEQTGAAAAAATAAGVS